MKMPQKILALFNRPTTLPLKIAKYVSLAIGAVILVCALIVIFFADPLINTYVKPRMTNAFTDAYPGSFLQLGDMHYSFWKNRLECDSIVLKTAGASLTVRATPFSIGGIGWLGLLLGSDLSAERLSSAVLEVRHLVLKFQHSQTELRFGMLHVSAPESEMVAESVKYGSLLDDEQFFANSQFRQTRSRFDIPHLRILGLDCLSLLQGRLYKAKSITVQDLFAELLVNMDKPYDKSSTPPLMPNEALSLMKETIQINSVKITNGRLIYAEQYAPAAVPGVVTFTNINVSARGIANHAVHPDTTVIEGEGLFMNAGTMKLLMAIPLTSKEFSLRYSGSLTRMDVAALNTFIEPAEHRRIKSGVLHSAEYDIQVRAGVASGTLRVAYHDLSIASLNKKTGSEKGIVDRVSSLIGAIFVVRRSNVPNEEGNMKIGDCKYTRYPDDYFTQYVWFALRNGVADVVGFPKKDPPKK